MNAIPDGIALGGGRRPVARRLVVVAAVLVALVCGAVIGRATAARPTVLPHRTAHVVQLAGLDGQNAQTRLRVMKKMNSLLRGSRREARRSAR